MSTTTFIALRREAREKRDRAIQGIRDEYEATLRRIAELEQDLHGRDAPNHQTISSCIDRCIPNDGTFTTEDIMSGLEAMDDSRNWRKRSIDGHLHRLRKKGLVKRVKRSQNNFPAIYVRVGVDYDVPPFEDMTLPQVVKQVLSEHGPMRQTELTVKMVELGYQTTMTKKALSDAIGVVLRGDSDEFARRDDKWGCR